MSVRPPLETTFVNYSALLWRDSAGQRQRAGSGTDPFDGADADSSGTVAKWARVVRHGGCMLGMIDDCSDEALNELRWEVWYEENAWRVLAVAGALLALVALAACLVRLLVVRRRKLDDLKIVEMRRSLEAALRAKASASPSTQSIVMQQKATRTHPKQGVKRRAVAVAVHSRAVAAVADLSRTVQLLKSVEETHRGRISAEHELTFKTLEAQFHKVSQLNTQLADKSRLLESTESEHALALHELASLKAILNDFVVQYGKDQMAQQSKDYLDQVRANVESDTFYMLPHQGSMFGNSDDEISNHEHEQNQGE